MHRASLPCLSICLAASPLPAEADTIFVTPSDSYDAIERARSGDEVIIAPGLYAFRVYLTQAAPPDAPFRSGLGEFACAEGL